MRTLLVAALLVAAFSLVALAPSASATRVVCTDALMPTQCSLEILCVYDPVDGTTIKCVRDPCWNAAVC